MRRRFEPCTSGLAIDFLVGRTIVVSLDGPASEAASGGVAERRRDDAFGRDLGPFLNTTTGGAASDIVVDVVVWCVEKC